MPREKWVSGKGFENIEPWEYESDAKLEMRKRVGVLDTLRKRDASLIILRISSVSWQRVGKLHGPGELRGSGRDSVNAAKPARAEP